MQVLGAGMAGLLAAGMLRQECVGVLEAKPSLPDNHAAVLRFKSSIVGDTLNIPFKKVKALKAVHPWQNPVADAMAYSRKTNGNFSLRSILTASGETVDRWIAPPDFPTKMARAVQADIAFNQTVYKGFTATMHGPWISTLPMPVLMELLGWPEEQRPEFKWRSGYSLLATLKDCDAHCSLYLPDPRRAAYRASINGDSLIVECSGEAPEPHVAYDELVGCIAALGLDHAPDMKNMRLVKQKLMKILPIDEDLRKRFIIWASDVHKVYSLGRFATWRPGLLLDDLVNDVRVIQRIHAGSNYDHRRRS